MGPDRSWIGGSAWNLTALLRGTYFLVPILLHVSISAAQYWPQFTVDMPDAAGEDRFGWSIALSGDRLLVGAPDADIAGSNSGAAYVFERNNGGLNAWDLVRTLNAPGISVGARAGTFVALRGDTAYVGAPYDNVVGVLKGSIQVFIADQGGPGAWGLAYRITMPGGNANMRFGESFIPDEPFLVGMPGFDNEPLLANEPGGVARFVTSGSGVPEFSNAVDRGAVGGQLVAYQDHAVVVIDPVAGLIEAGAILGDGNDLTWLYDDGPVAASPLMDPYAFGYSVEARSLGTTVAANDRWLLAAFKAGTHRMVASYVQEPFGPPMPFADGVMLPDTTQYAAANEFGKAIAIDGARVAVGAPGSSVALPLGFVMVYDDDPSVFGWQHWQEVVKLVPSDPEVGASFGRSVSISNGTVAVGAPGWGPDDRGRVYVFEDPLTSVAESTGSVPRIVLAPCPVADRARIHDPATGSDRSIHAVVRDMTGRCMKSFDLRSTQGWLFLEDVAPGCYALELINDRAERSALAFIIDR